MYLRDINQITSFVGELSVRLDDVENVEDFEHSRPNCLLSSWRNNYISFKYERDRENLDLNLEYIVT